MSSEPIQPEQLPYTPGPTTPLATPHDDKQAMNIWNSDNDGKQERPYEYQSITTARPPPASFHQREETRWMPLYFRTWFIALIVALMIAIAVGLEVALHFSQKNSGWPTKANISNTNALHFVYTIIPEAIALGIVATWASADLEIKKMQPFVDLSRGNARCETTLLLDYTSSSNFLLWIQALANKHYVVVLSTVTVILGLALQTLAASIFIVRDVWLFNPAFTSTTSVATMGLSPTYTTLVPFLAAAGYAEAAVVFNVTRPEFVSDGWSVAPFKIPSEIGNGTVFVNTTAIKSIGNCIPADTVAITGNTKIGFTMNATYQGCEWDWTVNTTSANQFGVDFLTDCDFTDSTPDQFKPPIFWLFDATNETSPEASVAFCRPNLTFANVAVAANVATNLLESVVINTDSGPFSGGGNLTGAGPLNGRAFNGIAFNFTNPDPFVLQRIEALKIVLPAAMFGTTSQVSTTPDAMFVNKGVGWAGVVDTVYTTYIQLLASSVYFVPANSELPMTTYSYQSRLELNAIATHILAVLLILIALLGTIGHFLHKKQMLDANLRHSPGTIAAAGAIISETAAGRELNPRQTTEEIMAAFSDKRLGKDKSTGKIILH